MNNSNLSEIEPFAQTDVVKTYLNGMNLNIAKKINEYIDESLKEYPDLIYNILKENDQIDDNTLNVIKESLDQLNDYNNGLIKNLNDTIKNSGRII